MNATKAGSYRVLLAEDDEIDIMLLKRAFGEVSKNTGVLALTNGEDVISYFKGTGVYSDRKEYPLPNLLLLDLKMPVKNGFEVLQWLRSDAELKRLPVVVMSSSKLSKDIDKAYELGANTYFVKSTDPEKLIDVIKIVEQYWREHAEKPSLKSAGAPLR
jgi:CheY-like chemotaxis protein